MGAPVTIEQNVAIKRAIRNDLRYITPGVPNRYFYRRGPWRPRSIGNINFIGNGYGEETEPGTPGPTVVDLVNRKAIINVATAATHEIIPANPGRKIKINFLTFTVGGDVNITLYDGAFAFTGAMDFGGAGEPRGIVLPPDGQAIELNDSAAFNMLLSAAVQVSGFVLYTFR